MNLKLKQRYDKNTTRGLIYAGIALLGMGYELFFSDEVRSFLIIMYSIVIVIGGIYVLFIEELE